MIQSFPLFTVCVITVYFSAQGQSQAIHSIPTALGSVDLSMHG